MRREQYWPYRVVILIHLGTFVLLLPFFEVFVVGLLLLCRRIGSSYGLRCLGGFRLVGGVEIIFVVDIHVGGFVCVRNGIIWVCCLK